MAGRLQPGVTLERAREQLKVSGVEFRSKFPLFNADTTFTAWVLRDSVVRDVRKALLLLLGAVGFVLLIACSNLANLMLARSASRGGEMALRAALGASRVRIARQLLVESLLLSASGGLLGLLLGRAGVRLLLAVNPGNIPRIDSLASGVAIDLPMFAFTAAISIATGILFGLVPALAASRVDLTAAMNQSQSRSVAGPRNNAARSILVVLEVTLAVVLLIGASLLLRSFAALRGVNPGLDAHQVLTLEMSLTGPRFEKTAAVSRIVREAERRLGNRPGILGVASTWTLPVENAFSSSFIVEGRPLSNGPVHGLALMRPVSQNYFDVFRIPLLRGRLFNDRDSATAAGVVVISEGMAKKFWPGGNPMGERLDIDKYHPEFAAPPRQVIGIVADVHDYGIDRPPDPMLYLPQAQIPDGMTAIDAKVIPITWAIRTTAGSAAAVAVISEELRQASGGLPVSRVRAMEQVLGQTMARSDFNTLVLSAFAGIALLLSALGIYSLVAYSVQQRRREIAIRLALGAAPNQVRNRMVFESMRFVMIGVLFGGVAAFGLTRLMASLIYGVQASDPFIFTIAAVGLSLIAWLASYVPARRATRVDGMQALHD